MDSNGHGLLVLLVLFWGTLLGIILVFLRITSLRPGRRRAGREHRLYQSR